MRPQTPNVVFYYNIMKSIYKETKNLSSLGLLSCAELPPYACAICTKYGTIRLYLRFSGS